MIFLTCREHGGVHRAVQSGVLAIPRAVCGATPRCQLTVVDELPKVNEPHQVCQPCFPGFHDTVGAAIWTTDA